MSNEVQKFDPAQLMNGVRDRIKATFVSLIPDEQWEQLVKKEVDTFFAEDSRYYSRNNNRDPSPFQQICRQVFEELTRDRLREYMSQFESSTWDNQGPKLNEELKKMLIEAAPDLLVSMLRVQVQNVVNSMKNY